MIFSSGKKTRTTRIKIAVGLGLGGLTGLLNLRCLAGTLNNPRYVLGPGDRLQVKLFQVEGFDSSVAVLPDGTVSLPRVAAIRVSGLNLDQARKAIEKAYGAVLRRPLAYVDLVGTRPLRVSVTGQVQRPGLYSMGLSETAQLQNNSGGASTAVASQGWPTLVEAIQKAGGLTASGDLRRVTLIRSGYPVRVVNYWEALRTGEPIENPLIYDGDSIRIPVAEGQSEEELLTIASSSFAPASITVNVVGEVEKPGPQQIRANSPLSQAVLSAGGVSRRGNRNTVELLRLLPNGTVEGKKLAYKPQAPLGDPNNPPLRDGDVVVVDRHLWAKTTDGLKSAVEPLGPVLNAASIFRLFAL
ncbi:SLBB domain-containing protein [Synechococcus sp. A10-1-5-1]|uniref:SLBB domain-containing protein n=1 Tax=Synechococcus sp. A10-1-5-1 TaxID=2936507 RepID=UPI002001A36A|nr:SLBB domain-containing protein [Synechococcus sp. A10-1-5-1]UPM49165.1 SLBB domain-containing protein [Synechococcus sp. A10-1-5-1]